MMSVIHAMVEKIYQAMTMLRDAEVHDRQQWLAYAQRQRDEAEHEVSGRAAKVFAGAMAEVRFLKVLLLLVLPKSKQKEMKGIVQTILELQAVKHYPNVQCAHIDRWLMLSSSLFCKNNMLE